VVFVLVMLEHLLVSERGIADIQMKTDDWMCDSAYVTTVHNKKDTYKCCHNNNIIILLLLSNAYHYNYFMKFSKLSPFNLQSQILLGQTIDSAD
jgi:hypothetical protein